MFRFIQPTEVVFGENTITSISKSISSIKNGHPLLICDEGIKKAGILEKVENILKKESIDYHVFSKIEANPTDTVITEAAEFCREENCNVVIGIGGGSPIDASKAVALLAVNNKPLKEYCGAAADAWSNNPLPIIAVPTTAGTGAEVSAAAMINLAEEHRKDYIFGPSILPKVAILDPLLTIGLPPSLTATTGIDAFVHALEAYVSKNANPATDMLAVKAIELVADNLRRAHSNGNDVEARGNMLLASSFAIMACTAGLGIVHSIAQSIGGYYNLPHGLAISVCLPDCVEHNLFASPEKYAHVAQILGVKTDECGTVFEAARSILPALRDLLDDLGIKDNLQSLGVIERDLEQLAHNCMLDGSTASNPRPMTEDGFYKLMSQMLEERKG